MMNQLEDEGVPSPSEFIQSRNGVDFIPYILYYRGRIFGGIYDDRLLVKPVPMALRLMPDAEMEQPYHGAKEMILVDNVNDRQFLCELVESMWEELPKKKEKKLRKSASKT